MHNRRVRALLAAILVTFLWSSSYVLTKFGLVNITPLTLVGFRYIVASVVLIPLALIRGEHRKVQGSDWAKLAFLGFLGYTVAQGLQCVGLSHLPAVTVTMLLNLTSVSVMILEFVFNKKKPTGRQLLGVTLALTGAFLFFRDRLGGFNLLGVAITLTSGMGWAGYMVAGRKLFREQKLSPLGSSAFTMGFGTAIMSGAAFLIEGLNPIPMSGWAIIIWLGVVNTAVAFFLWNYALETIDAFRLSVLQNTMLIQITLLSIVFLGERYSLIEYVYMGILFIGAYIVQTEPVKEET